MKNIISFCFVWALLGCNSKSDEFSFNRYFKNSVSFYDLIGADRIITKKFFYDGKVLSLSIGQNDVAGDNGRITLIDLDTKQVLADLKNDFFNYQNLLLSANDTALYISENGSRVMYEYNIGKAILRKIDILPGARAISYSELLSDAGFFYFLGSPYGSTIQSKENAVYKSTCSGGVMNPEYATISKPISQYLNLVAGCLNERHDSIQIIAIDKQARQKWNKFINYNRQFMSRFEILNVGNGFLVANGSEISQFDNDGNLLWSIKDSNIVFKSLVRDTSIFALCKDVSSSTDLFFKKIDLNSGNILENIRLRNPKSFGSNVFGLTISDQYAFVQYESSLYTISLSSLRDVSETVLNIDELMETCQDNFSGNLYTIFENVIYW